MGNQKGFRELTILFPIFLIFTLALANIVKAQYDNTTSIVHDNATNTNYIQIPFNEPLNLTIKLYWTTTLTADGNVYQNIEYLFYCPCSSLNGSIPLNLTQNLTFGTDEIANGCITLYYPETIRHKCGLNNYTFYTFPFWVLLNTSNRYYTYTISYQALNRLTYSPNNDTYTLRDVSGVNQPVDFAQFKLKIEKRNNPIDLLFGMHVEEIISDPESPPLIIGSKYDEVTFSSEGSAPNHEIYFVYRYSPDWFQFTLTILYILGGGVVITYFIKSLKWLRGNIFLRFHYYIVLDSFVLEKLKKLKSLLKSKLSFFNRGLQNLENPV